MTLTELSINRPSSIIVAYTTFLVLGIVSYLELKYDLLPKIEPSYVNVITYYPSAGPSEVESKIGKPIEDAVSSIENIEDIFVSSEEGRSFVAIEFNKETDVKKAANEVQRNISAIRNTLPKDALSPNIFLFALNELPILRVSATSNLSDVKFYDLLENQIKPSISTLKGVSQVSLIGDARREIRVAIHKNKLETYKLSLPHIVNVIQASNTDFPTGSIKGSQYQYSVRIPGNFSTTNEIRNLVIKEIPQYGQVKISDVATVTDGQVEVSQYSRTNFNPSFSIWISKNSDANTVEVSDIVKKRISSLEKKFKDYNLQMRITQDASSFTLRAVSGVQFDLMFAIFLVAITMLVFLHSYRNALIVIVSIPTSLVTTFIVMYALGFSLNLITLLAYSLAIGILVDDSIVVLENIYRFLEKGANKKEAALKGRNTIGFTAISITLVDVVVFIPLAMASGIVANIMREFAVVMMFSTLISLLVSFTIIPMLASRFSSKENLTGKNLWERFILKFEYGYEKLIDQYEILLRYSLQNKKKVITVTVILLLSTTSLFIGNLIKSEFVATSDRGEFSIFLETPVTSTIQQTNETTLKIETLLAKKIPEIKTLNTSVGTTNEGFITTTYSNTSEISVILVPKTERNRSTDNVILEIKKMLSKIPGIYFRVNPIGIFGTADQTPIQLNILNPNLDSSIVAAETISRLMKKIPGTTDVRTTIESEKPEVSVSIDREKMAAFGLTIQDIGAVMRIAFTGNDDSKFKDQGEEYPINVILNKFDRYSIEDVRNLGFLAPSGNYVKLHQFANIYQQNGLSRRIRFSRQHATIIYAQVSPGATIGSIGEMLKNKIAQTPLPKQTEISYRGDLKRQSESADSFAIAILVAIFFIYLVMVLLYDSYLYPLVVLLTIPLATIGALYALALTNSSLSIFSGLGLIVLIGLVGKNAIIFVDFANNLKKKGLSTYDALISAGRLRIRPILMTAVSMVIGLIPLALSADDGSEWKRGLAWVIIGGLISATALTLIVIPVVFVIFERGAIKAKSILFGKEKES